MADSIVLPEPHPKPTRSPPAPRASMMRSGRRLVFLAFVKRMALAWLGGGPLAFAVAAAELYPGWSTTQVLVALLKMPTCFGPARRVILDHLGNRYGQRFTNHWQFVRYAREHRLALDLTTPPLRCRRG